MEVKELLEIINLLNGKKQKIEPKEEYGGIRIVVLQRGWVAIGKFYQKGSKCRLENGATIRIWGTSGKAGLSYLAENGPIADKTILDKTKMPIRFHELTVVHTYDCVESVWEKHL